MDASGNELAAARLVDSCTVPTTDPRGRLALPLDFGLREWAKPVVAHDRDVRFTSPGRTSDVALLVTAGGADVALAICSWQHFHPGAPGIPGTPGIKHHSRGVKGIKGLKGNKGEFVIELIPLRSTGQTMMAKLKGPVLKIIRPNHTLVTANLKTGAISISDLTGDPKVGPTAEAATAVLIEHAAMVALTLGLCITQQVCKTVATAMVKQMVNQ